MLGFLLLGTLALTALFLLLRAVLAVSPAVLARAVRYGCAGVGVLLVAFLALTGRLGVALALGSLAAPLLTRWRPVAGFAPVGGGGAGASRPAGAPSEVETLYLRMRLDHAAGTLAGEILHGPLRGRALASLSRTERRSLMADCRRDDPPSASLLEAWLDRAEPDWRRAEQEERAAEREGRGGGEMPLAEAYELLGIRPGATADQIRKAHRRLMMKVHPDHGGSTYLAAKINQAKDRLLRP